MLIPTFVPIPIYPVRVEKSQLDYFLTQVRKYARYSASLTILVTILLHLLLWMIITPEVSRLYRFFDLELPVYLGMSFLLIPPAIGLGLLSYLLLIEPLKKEEVMVLIESEEQFIPVKSSLINATLSTFPLIYLIFTIMFLILTLIMPIYNISSLI